MSQEDRLRSAGISTLLLAMEEVHKDQLQRKLYPAKHTPEGFTQWVHEHRARLIEERARWHEKNEAVIQQGHAVPAHLLAENVLAPGVLAKRAKQRAKRAKVEDETASSD